MKIISKSAAAVFKNGETCEVREYEFNDPIGEPYYWDANCSLVMPCALAWYPEQSKYIG